MSSALPSYPEKLPIMPLQKPPHATVRVPGSKSITNRALVLAALSGSGDGCELRGVLRSEDTAAMIAALRMLGFQVETALQAAVEKDRHEEQDPLIPARL